MTMVCSECGSEIPEGADFCYRCGAKLDHALRVTDDGTGVISNRCTRCGTDIKSGDQFCSGCGRPVGESTIQMRPAKASREGVAAILLAFFGGLVDVFGLGQLVLRRWAKGAAFLVITAVLYYLYPSFSQTNGGLIAILLVRLLVFVIQLSDVFNAVYRRPS